MDTQSLYRVSSGEATMCSTVTLAAAALGQ